MELTAARCSRYQRINNFRKRNWRKIRQWLPPPTTPTQEALTLRLRAAEGWRMHPQEWCRMTAFGLCQHDEMAQLPASFVCSFPLLIFPLCQCSCLGDRLAENKRLTCWEGTEPGWGRLPVPSVPAHAIRSVYGPTAPRSFCRRLLLLLAAFRDRLRASADTRSDPV